MTSLPDLFDRWPDLHILTLDQPWADLTIGGVRDVENRPWSVPLDFPQWTVCLECGFRTVPQRSYPSDKGICQRNHPRVGLVNDGPFPFRLGIHASERPFSGEDLREAKQLVSGAREHDILIRAFEPDRYGALVGFVTVTGCHYADECRRVKNDTQTVRGAGVEYVTDIDHVVYCSRWAHSYAHHWTLADPTLEPLDKPIPMRGYRGKLWQLQPELKEDNMAEANATQEEPRADRHELCCPYDDCRGRLDHLLSDAHELREAAGEILKISGFKSKLDHADLHVLRDAVRRYDNSAAT